MAKKKTTPTSKALSNPMWELFCQYYTKYAHTFHNGVQSYAAANKINFDELPQDDAVFEDVEVSPGVFQPKKVKDSTYDSKFNVCKVAASRLITKANVNKRIGELLRETLTDENVDKEMAWVVNQRVDLGPKTSMIKEYNAMQGRTKTKVELTGANGERLFVPNGEEAQRVNSAIDSLFGK